MLYSYDIFDTILYRKVPRPTDIFLLLEQQLDGAWTKGSFSDVRRKSEFWLRRFSSKEITIEDIYRKIGRWDNTANIDIILNLELKIEKEYSILNQSIMKEIKEHLQSGDKVVLVSDMYWHECQIREWLVEKDGIFCDLPIYVSCDYGATKASGKLYKIIKEKEIAEYNSWIHTGDNRISDSETPEKLGITCNLVKGGQKYDFEKNLQIRNKNILSVYGVITETESYSNGIEYDLGASVVAPMVYQYVKWVIDQAVEKRISTLYFVLRDGYILKQVADVIIKEKNLLIRTEYIFGSRVAWRFPEITVKDLRNLSVWDKSNWIFRDPTVAYVPLERLGFSKQQVDDLFGEVFGLRELHSFAEFKMMLEICLENEMFVDTLEKSIKEAQHLLKKYFEQSINFNESFAFVDTNSTGKSQADLDSLFKDCSPDFIGFSFFYHTFIGDHIPDKQSQFVYLNSKESDRRFPEAFFRAPYNQCYGYKQEKDKVVPKFHESEKYTWNFNFDYDSYLKGILEFTRRIGEVDVNDYVDILLRVVNFDIVSKDVIQQVAKMPFNPDINGDEVLDFYPQIRMIALAHPFTELIYYPKGSYYYAGGVWTIVYRALYYVVQLKRTIQNNI